MLVSAIIPTTGERPELLRRAVASVVGQSRVPDEIIIVFDGDDASQLAATSLPTGVHIVCTGSRQGAGAARNAGAQAAACSFLAFLDDDDAWKPELLAAIFADDKFDIALTGFEKHRCGVALPEKIPPVELHADDFLVRNPGLRGSNLVIRTSTFLAVGGFDVTLPSLHDMDFGFRVAAVDGLRYRRVPLPLVEFHVHDGPRLSTPGSAVNQAGLSRYWAKHGARMTPEQAKSFRERAVELWAFDPAKEVHA